MIYPGSVEVSVGIKNGDITGKRSGPAAVCEKTEIKRKDVPLLLCDLTSVQTENRDCVKSKAGNRLYRDIRGERFGKLTAIEPTEKRADGGSVVWKCRCDCGNDAEVSLNRLQKGKVRSCGCLSNPPLKDYVGKRFGRLTVIEYAGKKNKNSNLNYWKCRCDCGNETTVGQTELQNGETMSCGCYQKEKLKEALKLLDNTSITILESSKKPRTDNKSGHVGVCQEKSGKWIAYISFKKKRYWLGEFDDINDAVKAREHGEEMRDDFLEWYYSAAAPMRQK